MVNKTVMEPAQRTITVPHTVQVPETKYRPVNFQVPVQRFKTEYETRFDTVFDTVERQVCTPVTKMVTKRIPVTTVHAKPATPCPPGGCPPDEIGGGGGYYPGGGAQAIVNRFSNMDTNKDGVVDMKEALAAGGYQVGGGGHYGGGGGHY